MAAPTATASSGLTSLRGSLPKKDFTFSCTMGMRVWPPTRMTSSISLIDRPASLSAILAGLHGAIHEILHQRFELGPRQLDVQVLGTARVGRDVRQVDVGLLAGGQLDLGLLGTLLETLQRQRVVLQIDALILFELGDQKIDDALVEVLTAEEGVTVGGQHLELVLAVDFRDLDDGDVEGAAAEVVHGDLLVAAPLVHAVGQAPRRWAR